MAAALSAAGHHHPSIRGGPGSKESPAILPGAAGAPPTAAGPGSACVLKVVEAQRAIALMREAVEKLAFLGSITPDVMQVRLYTIPSVSIRAMCCTYHDHKG